MLAKDSIDINSKLTSGQIPLPQVRVSGRYVNYRKMLAYTTSFTNPYYFLLIEVAALPTGRAATFQSI